VRKNILATKKISSIATAIIIIFVLFISCKNKSYEDNHEVIYGEKRDDNKINIAVTIYPLKAILDEIVGDKINIAVVLPVGASPHTFEPKPSDLKKISDSQILFYVSENLDAWSLKLSPDDNKNQNKQKLISTLEMVDDNLLLESDIQCTEHNHKNEEHKKNKHVHTKIDPHFWLSPKVVKSILPKLIKIISQLDSNNSKYYKANGINFSKQLDSIISSVKNIISFDKANSNNLKIFTFHNSFAYFINDFDLIYGGSIQEYSNKESGTKYVADITSKVKQAGVKSIFTEPQLNPKSAEIISNELGINLFLLDPIGGNDKNKTYKQLIINNAKTIYEALAN